MEKLKQWFFINGPSGAGKTTAICSLKQIYGYNSILVGPEFRAKAGLQQLGELNAILRDRVPIPNKYLAGFLHEHTARQESILLIDGIPRSQENISLIKTLAYGNFSPVFISIIISFPETVARVCNRLTCPKCGSACCTSFCALCGSPAVHRSDDMTTDIRLLRVRFDSMLSVIDELSRTDTVHFIDGSRTAEHVADSMNVVIRERIRE